MERMMAVPVVMTAMGAAPESRQAMADLPEGLDVRDNAVFGQGGGRDLKLTLFSPKGARARPLMPGMVYFHGGGWRGGNREGLYRWAARSAALGIVCASAEYRLSGEAFYPAAVEDAKCAVRWMRAHAKELKVDPERIGCGGGSAGGHLAAMLATTAHLKALEGKGGHEGISSRVCLAVLLNPALDMLGFGGRGGHSAAVAFLGVPPEERPDLYREASPVTHVSKESAPCLIFHGTADPIVPYAQAVRFKETMERAGAPVELVGAEGEGHGYMASPAWFEKCCAKMDAWLKERFGI
ncbi:MAG: alpha/beta hydrolase [Armatimonadetes bacterium]|nr:alpha/beta hydrolase [Armatimonadota bacterium]